MRSTEHQAFERRQTRLALATKPAAGAPSIDRQLQISRERERYLIAAAERAAAK